MRVEIYSLAAPRYRVYRYNKYKRQFTRVVGGIKELSENDIFFAAVDGEVLRDKNYDDLQVVLTKPVIESENKNDSHPNSLYYTFDIMSVNICIDAMVNTRYVYGIDIMPTEIPRIYKDCDFTKPNKKFFRSRKLVSELIRRCPKSRVEATFDVIKDSMDVFIKTH